MGRPKRPWFRFYCEALHDRKLRRLKPAHRWLWVAVLACARQSPVPGHLLINDREPVTVDDLADDAAMKPAEVKAGMDQIIKLGMVDVDDGTGAWRVTKWNERQYESDQSADRMQRHREGDSDGSSGVTTTSQPPSQGDHNDDDVTSRARGPAGADTDAETEPPSGPPEGDEQETEPPPDAGEHLELVGTNGFPTEPAEGKNYAQTLGQYLTAEGVKFTDHRDRPGGKKSDNYRVLLDEALERIGDEKVKAEKVAMQIINDLAADLSGEPLLAKDDKMIRRQMRNRHPGLAIYGVVEAIERAIDQGDDGDRESIGRYVRACMDGSGGRRAS